VGVSQASSLDIRRYRSADRAAVLDLLQSSLGWLADDQHDAFFRWKHEENPFGPSPAWVATDGDRVVGFRTFLRWEFVVDGEVVRAVRAVDTATHPAYRGRGIFTDLTMAALDDLRAEGVAFVFNTPNDQSRPGYLKMGWREVGRLPVHVRPSSLRGLARVARSRVPADLWSAPCSAGVPATDATGLEDLVASQMPVDGIATARSAAFLRWRYGFAPLGYRALVDDSGIAFFRVRRRGSALEAGLCEVLVPGDDHADAAGLARRAAIASGADHAVVLGGRARRPPSFLAAPGAGPVLTHLPLASTERPPLDRWRLALGDVELL
jgi:GNAT superfamily N-acetyltransferase